MLSLILSFSVTIQRFLAGSMVSSHGSITAPQLDPTRLHKHCTPDSVCGAAMADNNHGLNNLALSQPTLVFPKRHFGQTARAFNTGWYRGRPWLEYSAKLDACFWKTALEKDKGFSKHASSQCHLKECYSLVANEAKGGNWGNHCKPPRVHPDRKQ